MKIINSTNYRTGDLGRIFRACRREIARRERWQSDCFYGSRVIVRNGRRDVSGYARYRSDIVTLRVGPDAQSQRIARVYIHEVGHNIGVHHTGVRIHLTTVTIEGVYMDWIERTFTEEAFPLCVKTEKPKAVIPITERRYGRAVANLQKAKTRFKRAQTILRKWAGRVNYYEKKLAASKVAKGET